MWKVYIQQIVWNDYNIDKFGFPILEDRNLTEVVAFISFAQKSKVEVLV